MTTDLEELPASVKAELGSDEPALTDVQLDALCKELVSKRSDAVKGRQMSGIEEIWLKAEEAYLGIDDANRHEFTHMRWQVPTTKEGSVTTQKSYADEIRSTLFVRLTARYVDAASAKLQEILLPADDKSFSFDATPDADLIPFKDNSEQVRLPDGTPATRNATPEEIAAQQAQGMPMTPPAPAANPTMPQQGAIPPPGGAPAQPPGMPLLNKDLVQEAIDLAKKKAKKAEQRVYDWQIESQHTAKMRQVIFDSARLGVGIIKSPFPTIRKAMALTKNSGGTVTLEMLDKLVPDCKRISPWNLFPAPSCGENIHHGDYLFERDHLSRRQLTDLMDVPGYREKAIKKVLNEGPKKSNEQNIDPSYPSNDERYEVWYFYGTLSPEDWALIQSDVNPYPNPAEAPAIEQQRDVYVICTMVNDEVIFTAINPLTKSGDFPYHTFPWTDRAGHWAGVGIGEEVTTPQRMINGAIRAMMDNAGKSAGGQIVYDRNAIRPHDGEWVITRDKLWDMGPECDDIEKAFKIFTFPNAQPQLQAIVENARLFAEEATNIPLISQGQSGSTTPDTYGQSKLQDNNANQLLRTQGYKFDGCITEPETRQYYEWLLLDPNVPEDEKGDFQINAHGSAALVERAIQKQEIAAMGELVLKGSKIFGLDPKRWMKENLKSQRLNPADYQFTPEEQAKQDAMPPPKAPPVQAAEIRAQTDLQIAGLEHNDQIQALQQKLEEIKADLAQTAMKLATMKQLAHADHAVDLHKHHMPPVVTPPMEPPGQAAPGKAFEQ